MKGNKRKSAITFPWWCKIIAYILSLIIVTVCLFFTISRGISFGDDKVQDWLIAFMSSALASVTFTQPLSVKILIKKKNL